MKAISAKNTKVCVVIFTMYQIRALANDIIHYNKKRKETSRGEKRKGNGIEYGARRGKSLVGTYKSGIGREFVVWHCKDAFAGSSNCVDGVCGLCKMNHDKSGHSCGVCKQNIDDYKGEYMEGMMKRERANWDGLAPEECAVCGIVL